MMTQTPPFSLFSMTEHNAAIRQKLVIALREKLKITQRMLAPIFLYRRRDILLQELQFLQSCQYPPANLSFHELYLEVHTTTCPTPKDWTRWREKLLPLIEHLYEETITRCPSASLA